MDLNFASKITFVRHRERIRKNDPSEQQNFAPETIVKTSKIYGRLRTTRTSMRFRDFQRLAEAFGFELDRVRGSHHIYKHAKVPRLLNIQLRGDEAKPYQLEQFLDMVDEFGLELDD